MKPASILITGANGQLGTALRQQYPEARALDSRELDITNRHALEAFDWTDVEIIINAAAYTNVDGAENAEGRIASWNVNALGVRNLTEVASARKMTLFHISSEYVFDGSIELHTEDEPFSPLGVYAASKAAGDIAASLTPKHYILRTSWMIGEGKNFVRIMLGLAEKDIAPSVVSDQIGRLTFSTRVAQVIDHFIQTKPAYGTYNVSGGGEPASWAEVAREVFRLGGYDLNVTDVSTVEYFRDKPATAPRPLQSAMDLTKLESTGITPQDWRKDLQTYINRGIFT